LGTGFFVHYRIVSEVKRVEFVSDRMLYIVLRGCWCNIIVLNVHTSSKEKIYDSKDGFDEELEQVFDRVPKYQIKITLTLRRLMSYIYGAPILDVSRSHTTTQHSR